MNEADFTSVTEPHDFEHDHLVNLDTTLRCSICKELFTIPMLAPCSHSFCSMVNGYYHSIQNLILLFTKCIRESLSVKAECPVCRAPTSDGLLKRNTMLSEVVEAYKVARLV
jgi:E3 ubiquitin-protein ligase RAD18